MSAITLDEYLLRRYEAEAKEAGIPLSDALRKALNVVDHPVARTSGHYVLPTFEMGVPAIDLTKALALAAELDDEAFIERSGRVK